jgi:hypothetical protein
MIAYVGFLLLSRVKYFCERFSDILEYSVIIILIKRLIVWSYIEAD